MGWFDDIFGQKKTQESQQTGSSTTQSNAWSQLQPFMQQFLQQYSAGNIANANVPISPYQTSAATNQQGTTANLAPGYQAASTVAGMGISPTAIQGFMSPYISNVVDATRADFATQNARQNAGVQAQAAKLGALTGTQGTVAKNLAMESQRRTQDPIIAGLYNQGYGQAANTAAQSAGLQLQGAGTLGSLANAQTGANTALGNLGQSIWNNQYTNVLTPFQLTSQGAAGISPFVGASGQNTQSTGSSSGTGTQTDSPFNIGTDLLAGGLKLAALSDERAKHDIHPVGKTFDGQPIYTFKYNGSPQTHMGLMAQDVEDKHPDAVEIEPYSGMKMVDYDKATKGAKRADGGSVGIQPFHGGGDSFHDKVEKAFHVFNRMKSFAKGGAIEPYKPGYDAGGIVPYGDWNSPSPIGTETLPVAAADPNWTATVEPYKGPSMGDAFMDWHKGRQDARNKAMAAPDTSLSDQQKSLSAFLSGMQRPGMADGGTPSAWWDTTGSDPVPRFGRETPMIEPFYVGGDKPRGADGYASEREFIKPFRNDPGLPETGLETRMVPDKAPYGGPYVPPTQRPEWREWRDDKEVAPLAPPEKSWFGRVSDYLGRRGGESNLSNADRIAMTISGMGGGKVAGQIFKEMEADREAGRLRGAFAGMPTLENRLRTAEMTGSLDGMPTLAGARNPATIAHLNAQTKLAETQADKEFLLEVEKRKMEYAKELADAAERAKWDRMFELRKRIADEEEKAAKAAAPTGAGRFKWVPTPTASEPKAAPEVAPPPAAAPEATPVAPPAPVAPLRNNRGQIIYGTPQNPFRDRSQAGFGQYYIGPDGKTIYRRGNMRSGADSIYFGGP